MTYLLEPVDNGTRLSYICSRSYGPFPLCNISDLGAGRVLSGRMNESFAAFRDYIDEEIAAGRAGVGPAAGLAEGAVEQAVASSLSQQHRE